MHNEADVAELLEHGIAAAKSEHREAARRILQQVVERDARNVQAWLWLSSVVMTREERRECLERVLAIHPGHAAAEAGLRWIKEHEAERSSKELCPRCETELPPSGQSCPVCGLALYVACPHCDAYIDVVDAACAQCGYEVGDFREGAPYYLRLIEAYMEDERRDLAEELLPFAETEAYNDAHLLADVAVYYEAVGQSDRGMFLLDRVIDLAPNLPLPYMVKGEMYGRMGMIDRALNQYDEAAQLANDDADTLYELAQVFMDMEPETNRARTLLERALWLDEEHVPAHLLLGDFYLEREKEKLALEQYEHAVQLTELDSELGEEARDKVRALKPSLSRWVTKLLGGER